MIAVQKLCIHAHAARHELIILLNFPIILFKIITYYSHKINRLFQDYSHKFSPNKSFHRLISLLINFMQLKIIADYKKIKATYMYFTSMVSTIMLMHCIEACTEIPEVGSH